mmetsp:Transcript_9663/g.24248  ORF Transcript_9663/g.24248 Transcript_9663/m.24248 type:complete len:338 (+) Transcript_9663:175-1188(+)
MSHLQVAPVLQRCAPDRCRECNSDDIIEDWAQGTMVCRECGLVLENRLLDYGSEWRTFADDNKGDDPNRAGGPSNPLLEGAAVTTISNDMTGMGKKIAQTNERNVSMADQFLTKSFSQIKSYAERWHLPSNVIDRASEIFKMFFLLATAKLPQSVGLDGVKSGARGLRDVDAAHGIAASLFLACRNAGIARTLKETSALCHVTKHDIGVKARMIEQGYPEVKEGKTVAMADGFVLRFCGFLKLPREVSNPVVSVTKAAQELEGVHGRTPISIAAASIHLVCQLSRSEFKRPIKEISEKTGVAEVTIRSAYKNIYQHLDKVLPPDQNWAEPLSSLIKP